MNTLVSWIDADAVSGMARDMSTEPAEAVTWLTGAPGAVAGTEPGAADTSPVTRLVADDFRLPEHFAPEPFPAPGPTVPAEERSKMRNFVEEIRQKAEHSGLIPRPAELITPPAAAAAVPGGTFTADSATAARTSPSLPALAPLLPVQLAPAAPGQSAPFRATPFSLPPGMANPPAPATRPSSDAPAVLHLPPLGPSGQAPPPTEAALVSGAGENTGLPPLRRHIPHFEVPLGPLATRIRALSDWIRRQIETNDIFILDTQGCPVGDREAVPPIVAGTVILAEAARRAAAHLPEAPTGALYLDLEDERRLCVITTPTTHGNFTLGLILPDALIPRAADRLRRALKRTVEADAPAPLRLPPRERW